MSEKKLANGGPSASALENKINALLAFAVEECEEGDDLSIDVAWDSPQVQLPIFLKWILRPEPDQNWQMVLDHRLSKLVKYLEPQFALTRVDSFPNTREVRVTIE